MCSFDLQARILEVTDAAGWHQCRNARFLSVGQSVSAQGLEDHNAGHELATAVSPSNAYPIRPSLCLPSVWPLAIEARGLQPVAAVLQLIATGSGKAAETDLWSRCAIGHSEERFAHHDQIFYPDAVLIRTTEDEATSASRAQRSFGLVQTPPSVCSKRNLQRSAQGPSGFAQTDPANRYYSAYNTHVSCLYVVDGRIRSPRKGNHRCHTYTCIWIPLENRSGPARVNHPYPTIDKNRLSSSTTYSRMFI